jgi:hypothetical protein
LLAIVGGTLALLLGLLLLFLPLVATELSRPRDSVWGAVVLLLGLVLVTSADRLTGAPMLAVLCSGLLIGRLSSEVGRGRWRQLSDEERQLLGSSARWSRSLIQLGASSTSLLQTATALLAGLVSRVNSRPQRPSSTKRWVRPELPAAALEPEAQEPSTQPEVSPQPEPKQEPRQAKGDPLAPEPMAASDSPDHDPTPPTPESGSGPDQTSPVAPGPAGRDTGGDGHAHAARAAPALELGPERLRPGPALAKYQPLLAAVKPGNHHRRLRRERRRRGA